MNERTVSTINEKFGALMLSFRVGSKKRSRVIYTCNGVLKLWICVKFLSELETMRILLFSRRKNKI